MQFPNRSRQTNWSFAFRREALWMRLTARAVLAAWLLPLFFALFAVWQGAPAHAQDNPRQTVVVLDFATDSGIDPLLGRKAADALAVELQRSNEYDVVSRQRVDEAVGQQAGLQPPFNETAQVRLAQAVGATSIFSGTISRLDITPGSLARVGLTVRQLDAATSDYVNGTYALESTEQKLTTVANEILVDEAINKAAFSSVRSMRQTNLPQGTVLNTTRDDVELSIGARNGVAQGQRYSILRDIYNRARNITERLKIGELTIKRVENDQSVAVLSAGGSAGVRTGDKVRQIFVPVVYSSSTTGSVSPVTAPATSGVSKDNAGRKAGKGLLGLLGLVALVGLAGFGGGGGAGGAKPSISAVTEAGTSTANPYSTTSLPQASFSFKAGTSGFNLVPGLQKESAVGYIIYRGTSASFTPDASNIQAFVDGRTLGADATIRFTDPLISTPIARTVTIDSVESDNGTGDLDLTIENADDDATPAFSQTTDNITFTYIQQPLEIGETYYYRVVRIGAERQNNTDDNNVTTVTLLPVRSETSRVTGPYVPLVRPIIIRDQDQYDTDNFSVRINSETELAKLRANGNYTVPGNASAATGVDFFRVQVSTTSSFTESTTFVSPDRTPPTPAGNGDIVINLGDIRIPDTNANPYVPGQTTLFVRVLSRNTTAQSLYYKVSPTLTLEANQVTGVDSAGSSRFVKSTVKGGIGVGRTGGGLGVSSTGGHRVTVLKPQ